MDDVRYEAPDSPDAASSLLAEASGGGKVFAGGTDVMVQIHAELIDPGVIVDIKKIPGTRGISKSDGAYTFGAATAGMVLIGDEGFSSTWPGVIDGVALIGSIQVKGRASVGGNLCNASPAADSTPAMIAAGAICNIVGPNGERTAPVEDIVTGPGKTSLADGEFIMSFTMPKRPAHSGDAYLRLTPRTEMDIAVVGAGVNITLDDDGTCTAARVSLGAVAPTPLLVAEAAEALIGTKVDDAALTKMGEACSAACNPISDKRGTKEYRIKTAAVIARRAAEIALERAREN
ncbi:MAG: oxidoreductase [Rhodospirillaceae bacterium]|jgi:CO/xanthine dehydrogenase FAD-binding subunit|nr:oxidoreductase [Rhodospirillaceae bacterium]